MRPEEAEKLLGGYAVGTLTEAERKTLMEAAMDNQELFDALAEEEALRDLIADPHCRGRLLDLLKPERKRFWLARPVGWMTLAGSVAGLVVITSLVVELSKRSAPPPPLAKKKDVAPAVVVPAPAVPAPPAAAEPKAKKEEVAVAATPVAPAPPPSARPEAAAEQPAAMSYLRTDKPAAEKRAIGLRLAASNPVRPEVHYSILKDGAEAGRDAVFKPGDSLHLRVEANQSGFVYLRRQDRVLFPQAGEPNRIEPGKPLAIPLPRVEQPGEEKLLVVFSRDVLRDQARRAGIQEADEAAPPITVEVTLTYR